MNPIATADAGLRAAPTRLPVERRNLDVRGAATPVWSIGTGEPLVFLHGAGVFHGIEYIGRWAERFRVIAPFHSGFGGADAPPDVHDIEDLVLHCLDVIDQLGIDRFRLVGLSLGGLLASRLAIVLGSRVQRLALGAPGGLMVPGLPAADLAMKPARDVPGVLVHSPAVLRPYLPSAPDPAFALARYIEASGLARASWGQRYDRRLRAWMHRIQAPTLVLWGREDSLVPWALAAQWQMRLPNARIRVIENAGHLLFDESTEAVDAVTDFMDAPA